MLVGWFSAETSTEEITALYITHTIVHLLSLYLFPLILPFRRFNSLLIGPMLLLTVPKILLLTVDVAKNVHQQNERKLALKSLRAV